MKTKKIPMVPMKLKLYITPIAIMNEARNHDRRARDLSCFPVTLPPFPSMLPSTDMVMNMIGPKKSSTSQLNRMNAIQSVVCQEMPQWQ